MRFYLRLLALLVAVFVVAPATVHAANKKSHVQKHKAKRPKQHKVNKHR
jgi:multisubunit Na+/H+ antiporter MnhG subunit